MEEAYGPCVESAETGSEGFWFGVREVKHSFSDRGYEECCRQTGSVRV